MPTLKAFMFLIGAALLVLLLLVTLIVLPEEKISLRKLQTAEGSVFRLVHTRNVGAGNDTGLQTEGI